MGLLCTAAIIMQILEAPIPRPLPWLKPGMANSVTLAALVLFDLKSTLLIVVTRQVCANLLTGTLLGPTFFLGLGGSLGATAMMYILYKSPVSKYIGLISISAAGAVASNLSQLLIASFILGNIYIWYQLPFMLWRLYLQVFLWDISPGTL